MGSLGFPARAARYRSRAASWSLFAAALFIYSCAPIAYGADGDRVVQVLTAPPTPLGQSLRVMTEPGPELSVDEALRLLEANRFQSYHETVLGFGLTHRPVWAVLSVENASDAPVPRRLVIAPSWLDRLDVHLRQGGRAIAQWSTGDERPGVPYLNEALGYVFEPAFPPGRSEVLIRIETPDPMVLEVRLLSPLAAAHLEQVERYSYGFLYGFLFSLATYNLMLFLGMRRWPSLFYALYLLSFIVLNLCYTGRGLAWLWPNAPYLQRYVILSFIVLTPCAGLRFAREFLELDRRAPRLGRAVVVSYWLAPALLGLAIVTNQHPAAVWLAFCTMGLFIFAMIGLGAYSLGHGHASARYFLLGALASMVGMGLTEFSTWGFLPFTTGTYRGVEIGMMLDATLLALALADYVRRQALERERAEREARLDALTQLNNRRGFLELAESPYRSAERHDRPLAVVMLDIDHFKEINDQHGHAVGDAVLSDLGRVLMTTARRSDVIGRWGGEEFVLLLPETTLEEACELAERLKERLRERVIRHEGLDLRVTASFGVAALAGAQELAALIDAADKALYAAKTAGRNRVTLASPLN